MTLRLLAALAIVAGLWVLVTTAHAVATDPATEY